jgi:microcystin-dependent protein
MEPFLGEIRMTGFNFAPVGWALCNGQILSIAQNTALFSLLGTTYGGDGRATFALPDLRGRVPLHQGQGPGLQPFVLGEVGGEPTHTLITPEMPAHNHLAQAMAYNGAGNSNVAAGHAWAKDAGTQSATYTTNAPNISMAPNTVNVAITGSSQPHNNMQPYLTVNFIIALQGIFPSRN